MLHRKKVRRQLTRPSMPAFPRAHTSHNLTLVLLPVRADLPAADAVIEVNGEDWHAPSWHQRQ
eukprot:1725359-Pyramimonas_sp.AAC.1